MIITTIIYVLWAIGFGIYRIDFLDKSHDFQTKIILLGVSVPYTIIMWKLWKKMIAAYVKEREQKDIENMMK